MFIEYFRIYNEVIVKSRISTEDKKYVSHTDDSVTLIDCYTDIYDEEHQEQITLTRDFKNIKQQQVESLTEKVLYFQKKLEATKEATSYDHYFSLRDRY